MTAPVRPAQGPFAGPGPAAPSSWLQALRQAPPREAVQPPCPPGQCPSPQARTTASSRPGSPVGGPAMVRGLGQGMQASPAPECDLRVCPRALGSPGGARGKEPACQFRRHKRRGFDPWVRKVPREGNGNSLQYSYWKIPRTEEPGRLQPKESQRVGHGLARSSTQSYSCKCWAGGGPLVGCPRSPQLPVTSEGVQLPMLGDPLGGATSYPTGQEKPVPRRCPSAWGERRGCHHAMQAMGDLALCVSPSWRHA